MKKNKNLNDSLDELIADLPSDEEIIQDTIIHKKRENGKNAVLSGQLAEAAIHGGITTGYKHYQNGTGLFGMSKTKKRKAQINGGKTAGKLAVESGTVFKAAKASVNSPNSINNKTSICPHCKKEGAYRIMKRWHMDNCKLKK